MSATPLDILRRTWGYDSFRPMQQEIIESLLAGRDTIGLLPTGGGKSLTFQVPALIFPGLTIVVSPLISLMKDQVDNLYARGVKAVYFHSGLTARETRLAMDRCRLGKAKLAYLSPEKLRQASFIEQLKQWDISAIVIDEAHCISQWGYDFRPSYLKISDLRDIFPAVPMLALTASATPEVVADIADKLHMRDFSVFAKSFVRENISYIVRHDEHKAGMLHRVLSNTAGSSIVYVRSRRRTRELATMLCEAGIAADFYHAGLSSQEKSAKQDRWKSGESRVMVATNAFGMGIDKPDVRVVIHYDIPSSLEEYYQEAGRAGRDGLHSYAVMLVARSDKALITRRLNESFPSKDLIVKIYERLCNFLNIAVGDGFDHVYDFDFNKFCTTFDYKPVIVRSALSILTRSGYIEYTDDTLIMSRIMILIDKSDFYGLHLDRDTDDVFQCLLRTYPGLFSDYVVIDEARIAAMMSVPEIKVTTALVTLARMHVIHYIPRRITPFVYFSCARDLPSNILIPKTVYEDQRERLRLRLDAIKRFAFADDLCRSRIILEYFGEQDIADCGCCDVCRERRKQVPSTELQQRIEDQIIQWLRQYGRVNIESIADAFPTQRQLAIDTLRRLADHGHILLTPTGATLA